MRADLLHTLASLPRHPRRDRGTIQEFQADRLRRVVAHAYERVPYYRRLFDEHGLRPRRHISAHFRAPVFELYASYEFALIAMQCRKTGLLQYATTTSSLKFFEMASRRSRVSAASSWRRVCMRSRCRSCAIASATS